MTWLLAGLYADVVVSPSTGGGAKSTLIHVYQVGTTTHATLFTAKDKNVTAGNPVSTDSNGNLVFYAAPGPYDLVLGPTRFTVMVGSHPDDVGQGLSQPQVQALIE